MPDTHAQVIVSYICIFIRELIHYSKKCTNNNNRTTDAECLNAQQENVAHTRLHGKQRANDQIPLRPSNKINIVHARRVRSHKCVFIIIHNTHCGAVCNERVREVHGRARACVLTRIVELSRVCTRARARVLALCRTQTFTQYGTRARSFLFTYNTLNLSIIHIAYDAHRMRGFEEAPRGVHVLRHRIPLVVV